MFATTRKCNNILEQRLPQLVVRLYTSVLSLVTIAINPPANGLSVLTEIRPQAQLKTRLNKYLGFDLSPNSVHVSTLHLAGYGFPH